LASQSRVAFFRIAPNTDLRSPGDLAMMCRSSEAVAAGARLAPAGRPRFGAAGLRSRAFGGFRLDPLRFFVACTMGPRPAASAD
jgi:hypothetical protein